jgi:branched-chain amino acid transport system substrate-binding protein
MRFDLVPRVLPCLALCAALLVPPGPARAADPPYEINAILSLTGSGSFLGQEEQAGLHLVETQVNASGGLRGRTLKFNFKDDQSSPQVALQLYNQILQDKPAVVIGSSLVAACEAIEPLSRNGPVTYCLSPGFHAAPESYMFMYGISTYDLIRVNVAYFRDRGWKRIAAIFTTDATGKDGEKAFLDAMKLPENAGLQLAGLEHYGRDDLSVTAQVSRLKAANPQALFSYVSGAPLGTLLHATTDLGLDVPTGVAGSNFNYLEMAQFASILPSELYLVSIPGLVPDSVTGGPMKAAVTTYVNAVRAAGTPTDANFIIGWDPGQIIIAALRALGPAASAADIKNYIEKMHGWYGAGGEYDFRDGSQRGLKGNTAVVVRWNAAKKTFGAVSKLGGAPIGR